MSDDASAHRRVGVVLGPGWSHTVVVRDHRIESVDSRSGTQAEPGQVILRAGRFVPDAASITIDVAPLLLEAVSSGRNVAPVAVVRITPRPARDPIFARSPAVLVENLVRTRHFVAGGHDLLGNELRALDRAGIQEVCEELSASGVRDIAIVAPGSQACPAHERQVADTIQTVIPGARIAAASDYGGQGLASREATVILAGALGGFLDTLLDGCESAAVRLPGRPILQVARSDGGCSSGFHVRAMPALALAATEALELSGAAYLADQQNCRVLLTGRDTTVSGEVRHGIPQVQSATYASLGTDLVVPTVALVPVPGSSADAATVSDRAVVTSAEDRFTLAGVGAAVSRPSAWLDEVATISSAGELDRVRRDIVERATGIVTSSGAAPGSAFLVDVSAVALPYSSSGTIRIRVRVTGEPDQPFRPTGDLSDRE